MSYRDILGEIYKDMAYVEKELHRYAMSSPTTLGESSERLVNAGGKRLRPAFVLLCGKFFEYDLQYIGRLAVAIELIHMATLVHDDVIDDAATRRGLPTVRAQWGDPLALQTGDYLFAQALKIISQSGDREILHVLARVSLEMCEGEIEQINNIGNINIGLRVYLRRIQRKTAFLISACCTVGALAGGASPDLTRRLQKYGYYLGMAFQITDDILDFTGSEKTFGKPVGSDLRQGIITLPVIYTLRDQSTRDRLQEIMNKKSKNDQDWSEIFALIEKTGALKDSQRLCNRYIEKAKAELSYLPDLPPRGILASVADFIGTRDF